MKPHKIIILTLATSSLALGVFATSSLLKPIEKAEAVDTFDITFDMHGHGTTKVVQADRGANFSTVIRDNFEYTDFIDGDYYCVGFNDGYQEQVGGIDVFYHQSAAFSSFRKVERNTYLYAGWTKMPEGDRTFKKLKNRTSTTFSKISELGDFNFTNVPMPSHLFKFDEMYYQTSLECSELVNADNVSDKLDYHLYSEVLKTSKFVIDNQDYNIFENEENDKFFYKNSGNKEFVYLDSEGEAATYELLDEGFFQDKLVIVKRGDNDLQSKVNAAYNAGASAILIVNSSDNHFIIDIDNTHGFCVGAITLSAGEALKSIGEHHKVELLNYYTGTVKISNKRSDYGLPVEHYMLEYDSNNATTTGSLYFELDDPSQIKEDVEYKFTISYKVLVLDSIGYPSSESGDEEQLEEQTTITIFKESKPVPPEEPDDPEPPVEPEPNNPTEPAKSGGLPAGAIVGIVLGSLFVLGLGGFAIFWFVIKKKSFKDLIAVFKKK